MSYNTVYHEVCYNISYLQFNPVIRTLKLWTVSMRGWDMPIHTHASLHRPIQCIVELELTIWRMTLAHEMFTKKTIGVITGVRFCMPMPNQHSKNWRDLKALNQWKSLSRVVKRHSKSPKRHHSILHQPQQLQSFFFSKGRSHKVLICELWLLNSIVLLCGILYFDDFIF